MTQVIFVPGATLTLAGWKFRLSWWAPVPAGIVMVVPPDDPEPPDPELLEPELVPVAVEL